MNKPSALPWAPLALFAAGLAAALGAGLWQQRANDAYLRERLQAAAERSAQALRLRMRSYEYGLFATRSAIYTAGGAAEEVSREQFHRYGASLDLPRQFPGATSFGFVRRVPAAQEAAFAAAMRREGVPDFEVRQFRPHDGDRFIVQYGEPGDANAAALGLDLASDPERAATALAALRSGAPRLTPPITLPQAREHADRAFVLLLPLYRGIQAPADAAQREAEGFGWAAVTLVAEGVMRGFDDEGGALALALSDATDAAGTGGGKRFYAAPSWSEPQPGAPLGQVTLALYGRHWRLQLHPLPPFIEGLRLRQPLELVGPGTVAAALLALLLAGWQRAARRERLHLRAQQEAQARIVELNVTLEQQVQQRTDELRAILSSAGGAIVRTDLDSRITLFNPAAERMLRIPAAAALGRSILDFYDHEEMRENAWRFPRIVHEHADALPDWFRRALRRRAPPPDAAPQHNEWTYVRADGTRFPGLLNVSLLRGGQGRPMGFLAVFQDLSEHKAMEAALQLRTEQAEAANRAKSAFLANMSHEIRTPLNAVIGLSHLLQHMPLEGRQREFVGHIAHAGEQLLALVNDVLDLSKIEAGEMRLERLPFELPQLLQEVVAQARVQAEQKALHLCLEAAPELPPRVCGDPVRIKQVLNNLLGNAVKFTQAGRVTLRAQPAPAAPPPEIAGAAAHGHTALRFDVEDTGIGIPAEAQARIFEAFTQADGSTTRRFGGTGLGLSIVRRLVALMGGTLALHSTPGQGSRFSVTLTLALPAPDSSRRA